MDPISEYLPVGVHAETYSYQTRGDVTGGEVWNAATQFRLAGVPNDRIDRLLEWGSAYADRVARLQYEGRRHNMKLVVAQKAPRTR